MTTRILTDDPDATIAYWQARGLRITSHGVRLPGAAEGTAKAKPARKKPRKKDLLPSVFIPPNTFLLGIETVSEANHTGSMQARFRRIACQRESVQKLLALYWSIIGPVGDAARAGEPVALKLTRLGGRTLDRWDNLPRAMKAILDGVCLQLGIGDNLPNLTVEYGQEKNERIGVRIELSLPASA